MVIYVKKDESTNVYQSITVPLTANDRSINPQSFRFLRHMIRSMYAEMESAHDQLMAKVNFTWCQHYKKK